MRVRDLESDIRGRRSSTGTGPTFTARRPYSWAIGFSVNR